MANAVDCMAVAFVLWCDGGGGGGAGRLSELPGDGLGCSSSIPSLVNVATLSLTKTATLSAGCPLKRTVAWEPAPPRHH
jgi:hypothetical protein